MNAKKMSVLLVAVAVWTIGIPVLVVTLGLLRAHLMTRAGHNRITADCLARPRHAVSMQSRRAQARSHALRRRRSVNG